MEVRPNRQSEPLAVRPRVSRPLTRLGSILLCICFAVALFLATPNVTRADTIWLDGESSPLFGIIESSDQQSIVFKKTADGSTFESVAISKDRISSVVVSFDVQRLSSLVHGDWQPWQDYAEELFSQKQDPVARNLAIRLLVIIVGNSKGTRQRDAALNDLIALARNEVERENLLRLRYLETGRGQPEKKVVQPTNLPSRESRKSAAKLVQSIRRRRDVSQQLSDQQLKETVSAFSQTCSWQELVQFAKANRIDDEGLRRLVALELELRTEDGESKTSNANRGSWHLQANRISTATLDLPTIRSATGFDPQQNRFVDGHWKK